jgi:hypothetical protein
MNKGGVCTMAIGYWMKRMVTMSKGNTIWLELTRNEANAIMVMLDAEIENTHEVLGINLNEWETLDLEAYKLLAFHKFKTWYMENCADD